MQRRTIFKVLAGTVAVGLLAAGMASASAQTKVGFVYVGPIGGHGWTYRHEQGRLAIEKEFGDKVKTTFVESVKEGPDSERVIRRLAASGLPESQVEHNQSGLTVDVDDLVTCR